MTKNAYEKQPEINTIRVETEMHINKIGLFAVGLLLGNLALAHEGHKHEGIGDAETIKQAKEGKLCILENQGYSLGAVIEKEKNIPLC